MTISELAHGVAMFIAKHEDTLVQEERWRNKARAYATCETECETCATYVTCVAYVTYVASGARVVGVLAQQGTRRKLPKPAAPRESAAFPHRAFWRSPLCTDDAPARR